MVSIKMFYQRDLPNSLKILQYSRNGNVIYYVPQSLCTAIAPTKCFGNILNDKLLKLAKRIS